MAPKKTAASKSTATAVKKATKAAKAIAKGKKQTHKVKRRTSVHFYRPKTLIQKPNPKYPRKAAPGRNKLDKYAIIKYPLTTETSIKKIEDINTLTFIVDLRADKKKIKNALKDLYDVKALRVNTLIRPDGLKKAYVKLAPDTEAADVASRIGII
jgi:large subunit ribosomal protein L23Ae